MSGFARLKRALRSAIHGCGGIDGAAATVEKSRSLVGSWNNINQHDLPTLLDALALDEIAVIDGKRPEIVAAMARELGGVFLALPQAEGDAGALALRVVEVAKELGDVSARVSEAVADNKVTAREASVAEVEVDELIERAVMLRAELQKLQGEPVVSIGATGKRAN